jgi:hypothetical protein
MVHRDKERIGTTRPAIPEPTCCQFGTLANTRFRSTADLASGDFAIRKREPRGDPIEVMPAADVDRSSIPGYLIVAS